MGKPKVVVVGDTPVAVAIRAKLAAVRSPERSKSANRFDGASALVLVAHDADFEASLKWKQPERRATIQDRAERAILDAVAAGVGHVLVISSAMVHGAQLGREIISDDLVGREITDGFVGDIIHFEHTLYRALLNATQGAGGPSLTFLRPAALVGPGIDTLITRHFEAPRLLTLKEGSRNWQFCHIDDVAQAVEVAIAKKLFGALVVGAVRATAGTGASAGTLEPASTTVAVGGAGTLEPALPTATDGTALTTNEPGEQATSGPEPHQDFEPDTLHVQRVCNLARMRSIELSSTTAFAMAERLFQVGILPAPPVDMEYAVYDWTVMPRRLIEAGWQPQYSSAECVDVILQQTRGKIGVGGRRVAPRDAAALGAAGAAVAVLGTAAAWRQVRSGRK